MSAGRQVLLGEASAEELLAELRLRLDDRPRAPIAPAWAAPAIEAAARAWEVEAWQLHLPTRSRKLATARFAAMCLLRENAQERTRADIAGVFGMDHQMAAHAARRLAALREVDPQVEVRWQKAKNAFCNGQADTRHE